MSSSIPPTSILTSKTFKAAGGKSARQGRALTLSFVLLAAGFAIPAAAANLFVSSFSPTSGSEGELVELEGGGFPTPAAGLWAFVREPDTGAGAGAVLSPRGGTATTWYGALGPAAESFVGTIRVWSGRRFELPSQVLVGETGVLLSEQVEYFVPKEKADAVGSFSVSGSGPDVIGSIREARRAFITVVLQNSGPATIDLHVTIDGGSASDPPGSFAGGLTRRIGSAGEKVLGRGLHLRLRPIEAQAATPEALARDLERALEASFGALGLVVEVEGPALHLGWSGVDSIDGSFAVLKFEQP